MRSSFRAVGHRPSQRRRSIRQAVNVDPVHRSVRLAISWSSKPSTTKLGRTKKPRIAGLLIEVKLHVKRGTCPLAMQLHQMAETVIAIGLNIVSVKSFIIVISPCADKIAALNIAGETVKLVIKTVKTINNAIWAAVIAGFEPSFPLNFLQIVYLIRRANKYTDITTRCQPLF